MFPCQFCNKPFDTAIDLQLHQREFHAGNKSVVAMDVNNSSAITASHQKAENVEAPKPLRGELADGFPAKTALVAAGYDTYGKVRKLVAKGEGWWENVPHVGEQTAPKVAEAINTKPESEDE